MTKASVTQKGCLLQKHQPELAQKIAKGFQNPKAEFAQGFEAGRNQIEAEKAKGKAKFLERLKSEFGTKSPGKDKGKEMDIISLPT